MKQNSGNQLEILIKSDEIRKRVDRLVEKIVTDFAADELVVIGLLRGSFMFMADLARSFYRHQIGLIIDFMAVSSYGSSTVSSGRVKFLRDISVEIKGKNVLIVDDILDTGRTMDIVSKHLLKEKPAQMRSCVLLDKPVRREVPFKPDYIGFEVPDQFVVGYGLDHGGRYRELPFIAVVGE